MVWGPNTSDVSVVWRAICYKGAVGLEGVAGSMDAQYYTTILKECLLHAVYDAMRDMDIIPG